MKKTKMQRIYYLALILICLVSCRSNETHNSIDGLDIRNTEPELEQQSIKRQASKKANEKWKVANFRGLVMGKATTFELRKIMGEPSEIVDLSSVGDSNHILYKYVSTEEIIGSIIVWIDKRTQIIAFTEIRPDAMSKKEVMQHFGNDYIITRYSLRDCSGGAQFDSAILYEDSNGELEYIEYRDFGIAIAIFSDNGLVQHVQYLSEPLGQGQLQCK
jgi:hypothetical protein